MATNELAAILARRRTRDGTANDVNIVTAPKTSVSVPVPKETNKGQKSSSIAERIARLKQQSSTSNEESTPIDHSTTTPQPDPPAAPLASSRTSLKIAQLQGNLGALNIGAFGAPKPKVSSGSKTTDAYDYESVMKTGSAVNTMGVAMPGLAKPGIRIPGITEPEKVIEADAQTPVVEHDILKRVTGPKKRAPTKTRIGSGKVSSVASNAGSFKSNTSEAPPSLPAAESEPKAPEVYTESVKTEGNDNSSDDAAINLTAAAAMKLPVPTPVENDSASSESDWSDNDDTPERVLGASTMEAVKPESLPTHTSTTLSHDVQKEVMQRVNMISVSDETKTEPLKEVSVFNDNENSSEGSDSLFGSPTARVPDQDASTALFGVKKVLDGSSSNTALFEKKEISLLDSNANTSEGSDSLFGSSAARVPDQETSINASTALFGAKEASRSDDENSSEGSDSLFGSPTARVPDQETSINASTENSSEGSDSLFGSPTARVPDQETLFGGSSDSNASLPPRSASVGPSTLFGGSAPLEESTSESLFGAPVVQKQPPSGSRLFGDDSDDSSEEWKDEATMSNDVSSEVLGKSSPKSSALFGSATDFTGTAVEKNSTTPNPLLAKHSTLFDDSDSDESIDEEGGLFGTGLPSK